MSKDNPSFLSNLGTPQSHVNENEFENQKNRFPYPPSRTPFTSIPDPCQYQSDSCGKGKSESCKSHFKNSESLFDHQQVFDKLCGATSTSRVLNKGKSAHSEPNSAQSTPSRSQPRFSNIGAASGNGTITRSLHHNSAGGGRIGSSSIVSRGVCVSNPEPCIDVPHFALEEDHSFWKDHNVQVLIRIRPLSNVEKVSQGYGRCLRQESSQTVVWVGPPETRFTFDHIACESVSQEKLFKVAGLPMVENCMSGYNSCMFAYGQTGSGKTYTMMGEMDQMDETLSEDCGITPRIFEYLFRRIREEEESRRHVRLKYSCKCSFLEIYNEQITDLLEPSSTNLQLREDIKKGVYVENLTEYNVRTVNDVLKLLLQGAANRKIAATHMNSESSRSHSVLTCIIESRWEKDSMTHFRFGRLNLVDLAGSERQKSSGAEGDRLKEAANINKSLSTLGLVIMSLVDLAHGKHRHVPYRDSRLTFLLQDSLGGNSKTAIIANVSPSISSANETLSTLKFAQRAKLIQNNAKITEDDSGDVTALQRQIQQLKGQLSNLMKLQSTSTHLLSSAQTSEQSCTSELPESYDSSEDTFDDDKALRSRSKMARSFKAALRGALRREKSADMEVRRLEAEIEQMNCLVQQREEDAQRSKMMLRFREEKIKRLELFSAGVIKADQFYLDENNALREEIHLLKEKIDRNPEVTRFALENTRLLDQIRVFQDFCQQGERRALLAEIAELRDQFLEFLEVEENYPEHKFSRKKRNMEDKIEKELKECKELNSQLVREVDGLRRELGSKMNCNALDSSDATGGQLIDAQALIGALKAEKFYLSEELEFLRADNKYLMEMLQNKDRLDRECDDKLLQDSRKCDDKQNEDLTLGMHGSDSKSMGALQVKLENLSKELEEARLLNIQYLEDHASKLSQDYQTELVRNEVEMETAKTIIHLQEEIEKLHSELDLHVYSVGEENLSLRKTVAAKEDELRALRMELERATLELTNFLTDGSKSLGDASNQIKGISGSFLCVNDWISEHVERAAKICIEKEETILMLQNSLKDAQETVTEMEQKLNALKSATIALTEYQQAGNILSTLEEINSAKVLNDASENKNEVMPRKNKTSGAEWSADSDLVVSRTSSDFSGNIKDNTVADTLLVHTYGSVPVDIHRNVDFSRMILSEIDDAVNASLSDAEMYFLNLNSEIHDAVSVYKDLVEDLSKDVHEMRRNILKLKENQGNLRHCTLEIPSCSHKCKENQKMLQQIREALFETNNKLNPIACFYKIMNSQNFLESLEDSEDLDGWTTDCSTPNSDSSNECGDQIEMPGKSTYAESYRSAGKLNDQNLDIEFGGERLSDKTELLSLRREFRMIFDAFVKLRVQFLAVFKEETIHRSTRDSSCPDSLAYYKFEQHVTKDKQDQSKVSESGQMVQCDKSMQKGKVATRENYSQVSNFFMKFEEAHAMIKEADYMIKAMLKENKDANSLIVMWKQAGEELKADKESLQEEIKQLRSRLDGREAEKGVLQHQIQYSLEEISELISSLEGSFREMQIDMEELSKTAYGDASQVIQRTLEFVCDLRLSLEGIVCNTIENDISSFVLQCIIVEFFDKCRRLNIKSDFHPSKLQESSLALYHPIRKDSNCNSGCTVNVMKGTGDVHQAAIAVGMQNRDRTADMLRINADELSLVPDDALKENSQLKRELERKEVLLKGVLFDFGLLQELASSRKDIQDDIERLIVSLNQLQDELNMKTAQHDSMLIENAKLEGCLTEAKLALLTSESELEKAKETSHILSEQNAELKVLVKDLYLKKSEAENQFHEQKEVAESLEREVIRLSSSEKQAISSMEDTEENIRTLILERDQLLEQLNSLQERLDMARSLADENEALAMEARQESEASKIYAEQKEEEVKILERSVEELECTINVLEKKVCELDEEVDKHRMARDTLELKLEALRQRLSTVEDLTETLDSDSSCTALEDELSRKLNSRSMELKDAQKQIQILEEEKEVQASEIKQIKDYISELVLHAEAQASQYQNKYKYLEAMICQEKKDPSNLTYSGRTLDRTDKSSTKTRRSSSPFRCIASVVQQMNSEKDQEMSNARLRIGELEALVARKHKEVCLLSTKLATTESMTHDVIRDLLSVKLDITNYANMIDQYKLQKLVEEARQQRQESTAMEQEILNLKGQMTDLIEERERCVSQVNRSKADLLTTQMAIEQLEERDQLLNAQNDMLKKDKANLQKKVAELDDMVRKLCGAPNAQPQLNSLWRSYDSEHSQRLAKSQKVLSRINNQLAEYRRQKYREQDDGHV